MVGGREGGRKREGMRKRRRIVRIKREEERGKQGKSKEDGSEERKGSLGYVINKHQQYMQFHSQVVQVL